MLFSHGGIFQKKAGSKGKVRACQREDGLPARSYERGPKRTSSAGNETFKESVGRARVAILVVAC